MDVRFAFQVLPPSLSLYTDASLSEWGAHLLGLTASGGLVGGGVPGAHQCPRDESSGACSGIISASVGRAVSRPD